MTAQRRMSRWSRLALITLVFTLSFTAPAQSPDPLPSWNDGASKQTVINFVQRVTRQGTPDFVDPADRIAVFDNDGTLWVEEPLPTELFFTFDRIREMAPQHSDWKAKRPYSVILGKDRRAMSTLTKPEIVLLLGVTHSGMTTEEFTNSAKAWIATAQDARFHKLYTKLVYQPMLELLAYLRDNGFITYIVSGGEQAFMRTFTEPVYRRSV